MHLKQIMKRTVAMALILTMLLGLCACDAMGAVTKTMDVLGISTKIVPGQRLMNSAWINSDLEGSIDENTELNLKDDFHAAANRDWFLENDSVDNQKVTSWDAIAEAMEENKHALLQQGSFFEPDPNIMSKEELAHLQNLIWELIDLASDQEKRNELGVEPLRPYLEAVENIDSLDDLTEYLKNTDKTNISGENFVNFFVQAPLDAKDYYTVYINYPEHTILLDFVEYYSYGYDSYRLYHLEKDVIEYVLDQLGYTQTEISKLISNCYAFERRMVNIVPSAVDRTGTAYKDQAKKIYTLEDLEKLQGNFPLTELMEAAGISHSESFRVTSPVVLDFMGSYYKEKNLDKMKSYLMVHTILDSLHYLDDTCQEAGTKIKDIREAGLDNKAVPPTKPEDTADAEAMEAYRLDMLMYKYINPLLKEPFQLAYIGSFCRSEAKQEITQMVEDVRAYYVDLLSNIDWLSQETRNRAVEKVQKMAVRVMYPNVLPDYSGLEYVGYDEGGTLLDAVAAINQVKHAPNADKINQPVRRDDWSLASMSTLVINAYNEFTSNSIVILAGMLAGDYMYDADAPIEQNYGKLGVIIGHEVTHSFDTTGYNYDSEGLPYGWWTNDDEVALRVRSDHLAAYYSQLNYLPGIISPYNGQNVTGEAMSDMGGMKCMLTLAEKVPDFDYDLFFRSFASVWATQTSFQVENTVANGDEHPLGFLRTNVTLQQFDKFFETYGIGPGDGMYLAPEDRILVW